MGSPFYSGAMNENATFDMARESELKHKSWNTRGELERTRPQSKSSSAPMENKESLSVAELRLSGNRWFAEYKTTASYEKKKICLHRAIDWYEKARDRAGKEEYDEKASANKNLGVCYAELEKVDKNREAELHYLKHAARARAKALEFGELAQKPGKWRQEIIDDLEETINIYIERGKGLVEDVIEDILQCVRIDVHCPQYHGMVWRHRIDQGERILFKCMQLVGERNYKEALPKLHYLYYPIEEAKLHGKSNAVLLREVGVLEEETSSFTDIAEGLQSYKVGEEVQKKIKETESAEMNYAYGYIAMDYFKRAELLARGQDVELVAMAQSKIGITLIEAFNFTERARLCFREAMQVSITVVGNLHNRPWYTELTSVMQKLRDEEEEREDEKWENRRKPFLEELKPELKQIWDMEDESTEKIIDFLWEKLSHLKDKNAEKPGSEISEKKRLLKMNQMYHPDKIDEEEKGTKYKVLCEESVKMINARYNKLKMEDDD